MKKKELKSALDLQIAEIVDNIQIWDSKINTVQHVTPAALLKTFNTEIDFFHKQKNYYTLPETHAVHQRDCADKLLTHIESNCFEAVGNLIKNVPLVPKEQREDICLEDLIVFSTRKTVISRFTAKFYTYLASLILRAPSSFNSCPISEKLLTHGLSSHFGLELLKKASATDEFFYRVARVSPYVTKKLAAKLATKSITIYFSEKGEFAASTSLAKPCDESSPLITADYTVVLSPHVKLLFTTNAKKSSHLYWVDC